MRLIEHPLYLEDIAYVSGLDLPWDQLSGSCVMVSGATGLIGSFFVDVIMHKNRSDGLNCRVFALGRNEKRAKERFSYCWEEDTFQFVSYDINHPFVRDDLGKVEYVIHLASNTHPVAYATDPIGTIATNIIGTKNMLDFAKKHHANRVVFTSSNEVYGENRGDVEKFEESYCGYIDCNSLRAGYPESKRCGEALCQAYICQEGLDIVIPRLTRSYGPSLLSSDTKALSQFLYKGVMSENIVLKSAGMQYFSYTYVADAVSGLFTVMLKGNCGEAYNVADDASDIRLKDVAALVAKHAGTEVVFEVPDRIERVGYSKVQKARLENEKLQNLGWKAKYSIENGIERTLSVLKDLSH